MNQFLVRRSAGSANGKQAGWAFQSAPWTRRLHEPGWLILPLRAFLGITFSYAGLQKLANPDYLDPAKPTSVVGPTSTPTRQPDRAAARAVRARPDPGRAYLIAFGELSVGLGTLAGLCTRVAAGGGALLALTFFLTVSWNTAYYYCGADIVFVFAWTVLLGFGAGGVLSLDAWLRNRARQRLRLPPEPAVVPVFATRLRALCPRGRVCGLARTHCSRLRGCPDIPVEEPLAARTRAEVDRRTVLNPVPPPRSPPPAYWPLGASPQPWVDLRVAPATPTPRYRHCRGSCRQPARPPLPVQQRRTGQPERIGERGRDCDRPCVAIPVGQARSFTDPPAATRPGSSIPRQRLRRV